MSLKLIKAFKVTEEEHAGAFERFANAFMVDDYPEMKALGGKKDKGMDSYIFSDQSGKVAIVLQSCISPASKARTKVLGTIKKLQNNGLLPTVLIYCTSVAIGTELDETKRELRSSYNVTLEVCDSPWFVARHLTSQSRAANCEAYAQQILDPFVRSLQPTQLYSLVLEKDQHRVAVQYLEAVNIDRSKDGNLTKGIFDGLIACVTRDSEPPTKAYSEEAIVTAICGMFPAGHGARIREIVPGRIKHLVNKKALHFNHQASGYVLSFEYKRKVQGNILKAQDLELGFLAALGEAVKKAAETLQVDYPFPTEQIVKIGHQVVLWYLREQGKIVSDPTSALLNILNAEKLLEEFLKLHPIPVPTAHDHLTEAQLNDLLPPALFATLNTEEKEVRHYLRGKADLFIVHGFLQATPDVQEACAKLLGNDVLYLDTTILIRCIAEYYSSGVRKPLMETLEGAKRVGYQIRTWAPYINELVSHLRNRVLREWSNHYQSREPGQLKTLLHAARTLVRVFCERAIEDGRQFPDYVSEIIGDADHHENAKEFLKAVFGITTEELPDFDESDHSDRCRVEEAWLQQKRRPENIQEDRFQILLKNDVDSYVSILKLRRGVKPDGPNYGHKFWYLSLDRTPWRVARVLSPEGDSIYDVAMSLSYLMNCVATLAITGKTNLPEELIPATTILEESNLVSQEIRSIYEQEVDFNEKPFLQARRLRALTHKLKSSQPMIEEPLDFDVDTERPTSEAD
jgi:hypothetical protein